VVVPTLVVGLEDVRALFLFGADIGNDNIGFRRVDRVPAMHALRMGLQE
jgi:hypothetical protein